MNKIIIGCMVAASVVLAGCSGTSGTVAKLNTQVAVLDKKVDGLASNVQALREDSQVATAEAARANQRLDNQVKFYKK